VLQRLETQMLEQYARHAAADSQTRRGALWYRVSIVPLVDALVHGDRDTIVLGLPNQGAVAWAPDDAFVELPTAVHAGGGTQRVAPPELPGPVVELLAAHARFETLTARALAGARTRDDLRARRPALVDALLANPLVSDAGLAERLVDEILAASPA
jgi:alpha-galactosidase/6-phospho-beta-glucosidase family protein